MILYPAIDLKGGRCVRLLRGDLNQATVFNEDPANQAEQFSAAGFSWLHVVDLDGAVEGEPVNVKCVVDILRRVGVPVQLGGGVRSLEQAERWLEAGVSRVILGTAAVSNPALVREAARTWPEQIAVAVDVRDGRVAVSGWLKTSDVLPVDLARSFEDAGIAALIVTDISRDGAMEGVNVEQVGALADAVSIPVIASGGVSSVDDIQRLRARTGVAIAGAVVGKALYTGALTAADALAAAA